MQIDERESLLEAPERAFEGPGTQSTGGGDCRGGEHTHRRRVGACCPKVVGGEEDKRRSQTAVTIRSQLGKFHSLLQSPCVDFRECRECFQGEDTANRFPRNTFGLGQWLRIAL